MTEIPNFGDIQQRKYEFMNVFIEKYNTIEILSDILSTNLKWNDKNINVYADTFRDKINTHNNNEIEIDLNKLMYTTIELFMKKWNVTHIPYQTDEGYLMEQERWIFSEKQLIN